MTIICNVQPRPAPLDMRGIDPHAIYREAKPTAINHQAAPAAPLASKPKSEFSGYSINATNAAAALPAQPKPAAAADEFAGYSINAAIEAASGQ